MPTLYRVFGMIDDAVAGGSDYDTRSVLSPTIPDATDFWPVTGGTFEPNLNRIDRNAEVRGRRANTAPLPFRSDPVITVPVMAYRTLLEKAYACLFGSVVTTGGSGSTPYTHTITPTGFGTYSLPAKHVQMARDTVNIKMSGGSWNRITLNAPIDGEATTEHEIFGLWYDHFATAPPSASFSGMSEDPFLLRDAEMFIDGSGSPVDDLQGITFSYANNLVRRPYAGRNVQTRVVGTPARTRKLWFPTENRAQAAPDVSYAVRFGNTQSAQEIANWFSQIQKFVFEFTGNPLGGAFTASNEMMRITLYNTVHTGGGTDPLTARDDIGTGFDGGVFYSQADAGDVEIEFLSDTATL